MTRRTAARRTAGALRRARAGGDEAGTTLIEVVIAAVLLGILATSVLGVILQTQAVEVGNRARIAAANLAAREIDLVREWFLRSDTAPSEIEAEGVATNPHPLDGGTAGQPLVVDGVPYTVVRSAAWNITGDTGQSACEGGGLVAYPTLGVTVTVTWPNMGSIKPVVSQASFAPEKGTGVATSDSFIAVKVTDAAAQPNPGRTVRVQTAGFSTTGYTDDSGCAVIRVYPASGAGTEYTVSLGDPGYVDIGGTNTPSKTTGSVAQGQLNNSVRFSYDVAGTVELVLVDPEGGTLTAADVAGSQVTLVAAEYSGASGARVFPVTGVSTTITGLWPTQYGGYFGTTAPAVYPTATLPPGGTVTIEVPFDFATTSVTGLPAGTTQVIAVPSAAGSTCTSTGARTVNPGNTRLLPGDWDFFAVGGSFACSPGPTNVTLAVGPNDPVAWEASSVRVVDAPAGTVWALSAGLVGSLSTCPGSAGSAAVDIDAARAGFVPLPAGDWYVYVTDGAATGSCVSFPTSYNPRRAEYAQQTTFTWPAPAPARVNVTHNPGWRIVATTANDLSCSRWSCDSSGTVQNLGTSSTVSTTALGQGTWYVYGWDTGWWATLPDRIQFAGTVVIGPATTELTLRYGSGATVGP